MAGCILAGLGVLTLASWTAGITPTFLVPDGSRPMPVAAAIGFALLGAALLAIASGRSRLALACVAVPTFLGLITLIEDAFGVNLGIYRLLGATTVGMPIAADSGRLAPVAVLGFVLAAALVMKQEWPVGHRMRAGGAATIGSILAALGVVPLVGYLAGLPMYAWGESPPIAPYAAAAFTFLGLATLVSEWRDSASERTRLPDWLPVTVAVGLLGLTLIFWRGVNASERTGAERATQLVLADVTLQIPKELLVHMKLFGRLARRSESGQITRQYWEQDARTILLDFPAISTIAWTEPSLRPRWMVSTGGTAAQVASYFSSPEVRKVAVEAARNRIEVAPLPSIDLADGSRGFAFVAPLYRGAASAGFIVGVVRTRQFLDNALGRLGTGHSLAVLDGPTELYHRGSGSPAAARESVIVPFGSPWHIRAWADPKAQAGLTSHFPLFVLLVGIVMSLLGAAAVGLAQSASRHAHDSDGSNLQLQREVAARTRVEANLRLFRTLIDRSADAIEIIDPRTGRFLDVNDTACSVLGYSREEYLSLTIPDIDPTIDRGSLGEVLKATQESGSEPYVGIHRRKDGTTFPVEVTLRHVQLDRGYLVTVVRDVTDRKRAEAEHARLSAVVEQATNVIIITDITGAIEFVNPAFEKLSGYSRDEVVGNNPRMLKSGKQDATFYSAMWETLLAGHSWHGEIANRAKGGSEFHVDTTVFPLRDASGIVTGYVGIQRDLTREKLLEAELRQAQKLEAVGQLAGGVAHDFNNLLTVVLAESALTLADLPDVPKNLVVRESLEQIRLAGERAAGLTRQLLTFSRKQLVEPRILSFNEIVTDLNRMLQRLVREDVELKVVLADNPCPIWADRGQLEQVVTNLVVNAVDAMPRGGTVTVATRVVSMDRAFAERYEGLAEGEYVVLSVGDTGSGMTDAVKAHLFEPFFTTKPVGKGTGLGLATSYSIIRQCGGQLLVDSELGRGTTMSVYLPRTNEPMVSSMTATASLPTGKETILLVEDDTGVRHVAGAILRRLGYTLVEAADGTEAIETLRRHKGELHLVLSDVVMPGMGGPDMVEHALKIRPDLKVLFASGYTDEQTLPPSGLAGPELLAKPFTPESLARKVREVLDAATDE